ncbi:hypothetical protein XA68_11536 [Ophiocordyceps unilateralis]|uniref:Exonuclease V n=1 Tax=Ophiocordyceps unilateralis TaxID=268505 RepID=A0A2A9PGL6_OPHUN|nr:hypothetical protein XA68_11536 [Ophiocordyceps unilateralis]
MTASGSDLDSEYGYDFSPEEELQLMQLAAQASSHVPTEADDNPSLQPTSSVPVRMQVGYPDLSRALSELRDQSASSVQSPLEQQVTGEGTRSPLQRFRSYPRKPLSVSDLTSGAWCELQYWYTLTRLPGGRRSRTPAMRQGSKLHQTLENEVHVPVKVDISTKEDGFALKLWNLIQGLRTLRETGLTRELEVWGLVDGNMVNGIIDGVSHEHPNPEFEEELSSQEAEQGSRQSTLTDYFPPKKKSGPGDAAPKVYLTDVKTRGNATKVSGAQLRPAKIQLLLYHRFLAAMASDELDFSLLVGRYGLNPDRLLSDALLAQIGGLHGDVFYDAPSSPVDGQDEQDETDADAASSPMDEAIRYRSLGELWSLVRKEMKKTFPEGQDSLGHMLRVQYVHRSDGRSLHVHDFPVSKQALDAYLGRYMSWWRGEREAKGVDIEEAFKCRSCEFAADCEWRSALDADRVEAAQKKVAARGRRSKKKKKEEASE